MNKLFLSFIISILLISNVSAITTLSLDKIDFNSNDPTLAKPAFVLTGVENGGLQYAEFSINDLESALDSGYELTGSGTIKSQLSNYKITYPVERRFTYYKPRQICEDDGDCVGYFAVDSLANTWCYNLVQSKGGYGADAFATSNPFGFICVAFFEDGYYGDILEGTHQFTDTITLSIAGKASESITITQEDRNGYIEYSGGRHMLARVEGAISDFTDVPRPDLQVGAYYDPDTNRWKVISNYDDYNRDFNPRYGYSAVESYFYSCIGGFINPLNNEVQTCLSRTQQYVDNGQATSFVSSGVVSGTSTSNGQLVVTPSQVFKYPLLTLTIDADWVGIFRPVGKPVIENVEKPSRITEGTPAYLVSTVKNDANVDASFIYSWSCTGPFSVQSIGTQSFNANQVREISQRVTAQTSSGSESGSCVLTVKDSENPTSKDTESVSLIVYEANQCAVEGQQQCTNNAMIQECSNINGVLTLRTIAQCPNGCQENGNFAVCKDVVVPLVCGDEICAVDEQDENGDFYCEQDCSLIPPVDGDGICDYRERSPSSEYYSVADCGEGTKINWGIISVILGALVLVGGALYLRLRMMGYFK